MGRSSFREKLLYRALRGRRKALIHCGMSTDAVSNKRIRRASPTPSDQQSLGFGKGNPVPPESLLANLFGNCARKAIPAKFGREKYHKRPENIGDNARGQGAVAQVDPPACPTEIQQKRTCLQIPAQSRFFLHDKIHLIFVTICHRSR